MCLRWDTNLSRCSKQIRSLETLSFFDIIFFRFSTEFSPSTTTEKLPPVVVVTFSVIGLTTADALPELELVPTEPHPIDGPDEVDGDGPPSRESPLPPPPPSPDLSIVLLGTATHSTTLTLFGTARANFRLLCRKKKPEARANLLITDSHTRTPARFFFCVPYVTPSLGFSRPTS